MHILCLYGVNVNANISRITDDSGIYKIHNLKTCLHRIPIQRKQYIDILCKITENIYIILMYNVLTQNTTHFTAVLTITVCRVFGSTIQKNLGRVMLPMATSINKQYDSLTNVLKHYHCLRLSKYGLCL